MVKVKGLQKLWDSLRPVAFHLQKPTCPPDSSSAAAQKLASFLCRSFGLVFGIFLVFQVCVLDLGSSPAELSFTDAQL